MIRTDEGLEQTRQALVHMENALKHLQRDVLPLNPARFALMAEPIVDYIRNLRREIEDYIGYTFAVEQQSEPEIARMLEGTDPAISPTSSDEEANGGQQPLNEPMDSDLQQTSGAIQGAGDA